MKSKAVFLLVIFLLNTLVGFGCALGMEGNDTHEAYAHIQQAAQSHKDSHRHDGNHDDQHHHKTDGIRGSTHPEEDFCCKALVNDLVIQSKLIPENGKLQLVLPVVLLPNHGFILRAVVIADEPDRSVYADRREKPPNEDIRISIQSFQI